MLTVYEATDETAIEKACAQTGAPHEGGDRTYILADEGEIRGAGLLRLRGGAVVIVGAFGKDLAASERDLLCRSLLYACTRLSPIRLRVDGDDPYWRTFGFAPADGGWEIRNTDIVFEH